MNKRLKVLLVLAALCVLCAACSETFDPPTVEEADAEKPLCTWVATQELNGMAFYECLTWSKTTLCVAVQGGYGVSVACLP